MSSLLLLIAIAASVWALVKGTASQRIVLVIGLVIYFIGLAWIDGSSPKHYHWRYGYISTKSILWQIGFPIISFIIYCFLKDIKKPKSKR
jgi:hypothetical protein